MCCDTNHTAEVRSRYCARNGDVTHIGTSVHIHFAICIAADKSRGIHILLGIRAVDDDVARIVAVVDLVGDIACSLGCNTCNVVGRRSCSSAEVDVAIVHKVASRVLASSKVATNTRDVHLATGATQELDVGIVGDVLHRCLTVVDYANATTQVQTLESHTALGNLDNAICGVFQVLQKFGVVICIRATHKTADIHNTRNGCSVVEQLSIVLASLECALCECATCDTTHGCTVGFIARRWAYRSDCHRHLVGAVEICCAYRATHQTSDVEVAIASDYICRVGCVVHHQCTCRHAVG